MKRTEINITERRTIEDLFHRKMDVSEIARQINRHRATVYREIKRNFFKDDELPKLNGYYGMTAQRCAAERRARRRNWSASKALISAFTNFCSRLALDVTNTTHDGSLRTLNKFA